MEIKEIAFGSREYEQSKLLRNEILRIPLGLKLSERDLQGEDTQRHIVIANNSGIVGVLIAKPLSPTLIQFRMMALLPDYQKAATAGSSLNSVNH